MEPRYNLATKVMSNGVEVIVAGPRGQNPGSKIEPEFLRLLSSTVTRPITLAPHTLSRHMSMLLPSKFQTEDELISSLHPKDDLVTHTRYTTVSFPRTTIHNNVVSMITDTTVITNVEKVHPDLRPTTIHKTLSLSASPVLQTNVHRTVFTHLYTVLDEQQPLVASSQHTVTNTNIALHDDVFLEPSETFPMSQTHLSTRAFTKTLTDGSDFQVVSTTDVVTEVIVTDPPEIETQIPTVDVTKTYFVTYTYYKTVLEGTETKISSDVSVSSDVTVEKYALKTTTPKNPIAEALIDNESDHLYEKFKVKSTTEDSKIKFKTKSKIKPTKSHFIASTSDLNATESLGLTSLKVWGPVLTAMKDFLQKTKEPIEPKQRKTTQRTPVYIPVGSFADSEVGESAPQMFFDRKDNTPIPILEGGIPIRPGQVITTNSDVIIGRPADSGPRPPQFAVKDTIPIDMKPPPLLDEPLGQFSHKKQVDVRPVHHPLDDGSIDLNPPPPPPNFETPILTPIPIPVHLPHEVVENYANPIFIDQQEIHKADRSNGQLLVNIQPSQVAQVVIPHGSSTAVIIQDEPQTKGEVLDDPKPHPEPETVGFVKAEPVLKVEPDLLIRPKPNYNDIGMTPPKSGTVVNVPLNIRNESLFIDNLSPPPPSRVNHRFPEPVDFMLPPPRPAYARPVPIPIGAANLEQHYHTGEISIGDDDSDLKTEDGEELQESNSRPLQILAVQNNTEIDDKSDKSDTENTTETQSQNVTEIAHSEEVMGLSPPPMELPRIPPPPRQKPPFPFVIPTTTAKIPLTLIELENDFPPVRSPDLNKKPFKPEDMFPPKLPENFVPHEMPKPVTSLPIDVPKENVTIAEGKPKLVSRPLKLPPPHLHEYPPPPTRKPFESQRPKYRPDVKVPRFPHFEEGPRKELKPPPPRPPIDYPSAFEQPPPLPVSKAPEILVATTTKKPEIFKRPMVIRRPVYKKPEITTFRPTPTLETVKSTSDIVTTPIASSTTEKESNYVTSIVTSGSTTIFGDLYTDPILLQPSRVVESSQGVQFTFSDQNGADSSLNNVLVLATSHILPTHSTTLTVTSTRTTVVHAAGQTPVTRTILLTTTIISTIVDKITETQTLLKATTSTVTQTHTISTTKTALVVPTAIYPSRGNVLGKPEIFVTEPHDKMNKPGKMKASSQKPVIFVADPDMDTMTISVSSSMSKKGQSPPILKNTDQEGSENESILVTLTDKPVVKKEPGLVLAGILKPEGSSKSLSECQPECRPSRNELCVKQDGQMKCICRPGFARMFPNHPCKPTYTYSVQMELARMGNEVIEFDPAFEAIESKKYGYVAGATKEGLTRMIMQSDLRDSYHGLAITGFKPMNKKVMVDFYVQLSENVNEGKILNVFKKSLRSSNYSLGGTEIVAARGADNIQIQDFNECANSKFYDCSDNGRCFNMKGTYTCSCKEGFTDISENPQYPGRLCSDMIGCEYCSYHGSCYSRNDQTTCECFQWYSGDRCRINLKVLLIALVTIGAIVFALLVAFLIISCIRKRTNRSPKHKKSSGYLRYRSPTQQDKHAMLPDTSSESSVENLPYITPVPPPVPVAIPVVPAPVRKPVLRQTKRPAPQRPDQRDRSLTVMIPRVRYRGVSQVTQPVMSTFTPANVERKLIGYLEGGKKEEKTGGKVFEYEYKTSNINFTDGTSSGERKSTMNGRKRGAEEERFRRYSDQTPLHAREDAEGAFRKYSAGALVSAGYAVSTTAGLSLPPAFDEEQSTIRTNTLKSNRSQFTTLNRTGDHKTMSEARSYDETMIHPPTRALLTQYSESSSSRQNENHTMVERDLGSTFYLPESQLFRPAGDRGSDVSNFDSL